MRRNANNSVDRRRWQRNTYKFSLLTTFIILSAIMYHIHSSTKRMICLGCAITHEIHAADVRTQKPTNGFPLFLLCK